MVLLIVSRIPASNLPKSATNAKTLDFKTCLKNAFQSPFPSLAPSINPGISMTLKRKFPTETEARFGTNVVNGYSATFAFTSAIQLISEDFPTLGVQISPTSAKSCSSRTISLLCPGSQRI